MAGRHLRSPGSLGDPVPTLNASGGRISEPSPSGQREQTEVFKKTDRRIRRKATDEGYEDWSGSIEQTDHSFLKSDR